MLLLTCGEVDLSLGTVFIAFPFIVYFLWSGHGFPIGLAMAVGISRGGDFRSYQRPHHDVVQRALLRDHPRHIVRP